MSQIVTHLVELETEECYKCHILFAMPKRMKERCRIHGDGFYCPNGHAQVYTKSEITRLEEKLAEERRRRAQTESQLQFQIGSNRALKGVITRTKKRISKGVCPCCNRQFLNLTRHMENQHPEYEDSENGEVPK